MIPNILVIEDDKDIRKYLKDFLIENNYTPHLEERGATGLKYFKEYEPDLVLLDLGLPDIDGESICAEMYRTNPKVPVIILSAKSAIGDKVKVLNVGADDYVTKPFVADELLARIRARLRSTMSNLDKLKIADLELDLRIMQVKRAGRKIELTPQEFKLLEYLMENSNMVLSQDLILNRIWGYSAEVESHAVEVYMGYLRKKIDGGFKKKLLRSVRGFGYTIRA